ncbi:Hypothetical predicted protein [Mytilus galloprovincialis]|uniref:Endonuclease/exonuclease/phosphatase domain-containing protein n=1 Tax=Mytilus galloprovincialis TaxID=29158 RepID=A0A8B6GSR8_MYTGA|nr:Hypothetical predicted protein [Mytilus galloprovincialis]
MGKKRRRNNSSKTGLTPPEKTNTKMAASNTIDQNKTMDLSQVISEAHESLHGNISPTAAVSFVEPNSQHCSKSIFQRPPVPPYPLQSTPVHEPQRISQSPMPCPQISSYTDSDYVQWFEISPELTGLRANILVGGVYIPPEYSKYSTDNAFSEIETEMMQFSENASSIILLGDFNARTATMPDFIVPDDTLFDILDLTDNQDVDTLKNMYSYNFLLDYNIPLQRSSEDKKSNGFGSKLIDMCKRCSLYIANGRLFDDTIGKTTCKNVSLIDYLIISPDLFNYITNFNVLDFDPMISDVHNRIHFTLSFQTLKQVNPKNINDLDHTKIKWNPVHANQFQQVLSNRLGEIDSALDDLDSNQNITTEQVNMVVNDLGNVLTQTASSVLGNSNIRSYKSSNSNKPWFDRACRGKRDAFHQVKAKFKHDKSDNVRLLLNERSREFKKQMSNSFNKYKDKCANELRNFSKSDSKQFWKLFE